MHRAKQFAGQTTITGLSPDRPLVVPHCTQFATQIYSSLGFHWVSLPHLALRRAAGNTPKLTAHVRPPPIAIKSGPARKSETDFMPNGLSPPVSAHSLVGLVGKSATPCRALFL